VTDTDVPLVSVVIPVFNAGAYLAEAVASVENQTYPNMELVLVDGGSSDGSDEWIRNYASTNPCITAELPAGTPAAQTWTTACEMSTGQFVKLLCQDDILYPEAVSAQVASLLANLDAAWVASKRDVIDSQGRIISRARGAQGLAPGLYSGSNLIRHAYTRAQNVFGEPLAVTFRREQILSAMPWDDTNPFMLDLDMYRRTLATSSGVITHDCVGAFRVSSQSWSTRLASDQSRQVKSWQATASQTLSPPPTAVESLAGRLNRLQQSLLKRAVYTWLGIRQRL